MEEENKISEETEDLTGTDRHESHIKELSNHGKNIKGKLIWMVVFVIIAVLTISTIMAQDEFSFAEFGKFIIGLDPVYLLCAVACMIAYIFAEGFAILSIIKAFGYKRRIRDGFIYSSGDIYFSAITPSATGGQPASAYFMMKDGVPGVVVTVTLVLNLILYTFAILLIGTVSFLINPRLVLGLMPVSQVLVIVGSFMLCMVAVLFILVLFKGNLLLRIGNAILDFLYKIKIVRKLDSKKKKLFDAVESYKGHVAQLSGKRRAIVKAFFFNVMQRGLIIAVTVFAFLASGGEASAASDVWVLQCLVILGTNTMPVPGAMGLSDLILIDAFGAIGLDGSAAMNLNLLSRTVSFYSCVILCAVSLVIRLLVYKISKNKNVK